MSKQKSGLLLWVLSTFLRFFLHPCDPNAWTWRKTAKRINHGNVDQGFREVFQGPGHCPGRRHRSGRHRSLVRFLFRGHGHPPDFRSGRRRRGQCPGGLPPGLVDCHPGLAVVHSSGGGASSTEENGAAKIYKAVGGHRLRHPPGGRRSWPHGGPYWGKPSGLPNI